MAELELVCAEYGEGTVFSVVVARAAKVEALQEAIVTKKKDVNDRFRVDPAKVALYVARDQSGAWLTDDDTLKAQLLQGKSEQQFKTMYSSWLLNDEEYFGEETPPTSKAIHVLVELPQTAPPSTGLWLVRGSVTHALSTKGVRCRLYRLAGLNLGYYDPARRDGDKESALWYDGTTLCFHLLFETKQDALLFENAVMDEKLMQGSPLNTQEIETRVTRVGAAATEPKRVFFADYDPQDSESLQESISSLFSSTSVTVVDPDTDEFRYQRIEGEDIFTPYVKAESCHLVSRKLCHEKSEFSKYDRDTNNRLALSREMHGYYDGMSCTIPLIAIRPGTIDTQPSIGDRIKVEVFVQVFDAQCTARAFNRLKVGSCKTDDPLTRKTYVHVKDPATFVRFLEWKWAETQEHWGSFLSMTPAVD